MQQRSLIEGWRFLAHSYALVAQSHSLCLLQRAAIDLRFRDLPYYSTAWRRTRNIFRPPTNRRCRSFAAPMPHLLPMRRSEFGAGALEVTPPATGRKLVYATPEWAHPAAGAPPQASARRPTFPLRSTSSPRRTGPPLRSSDSASAGIASMSCRTDSIRPFSFRMRRSVHARARASGSATNSCSCPLGS